LLRLLHGSLTTENPRLLGREEAEIPIKETKIGYCIECGRFSQSLYDYGVSGLKCREEATILKGYRESRKNKKK
jgi:hypothetical protein